MKSNYRKYILFIGKNKLQFFCRIIFFVNFFYQPLFSQTFLNGDFENNTAPIGCNYNLQNSQFNSYMSDVNAYGAGQELDIIINGCYMPTVQNGIFCIALAGINVDEFAMTLSSQLTMGNSYTFTFWAYSDVTFTPQGNLEIGLSSSNSSFGNLIYTATTVPSTWTQYTVSFVAPNNGNYITVRNVSGASAHWNKVDNFTFVGCSSSVNLGNDTTICQGATFQLNAQNPNATYLWQDNSTNSTYSVLQTGTYWVQCTDSCGVFSDTIHVNVNSFPIVNLGNDTSICQGAILQLNPQITNASYLWQNGSTNQTFTVSQAGTYWVQCTNSCGVSSDTIHVNINPIPNINLGSDTSICQGVILQLNPQISNASYLWQNGSINQTFPVSQSGSYWVQCTNSCGVFSDTIKVIVNSNPFVNLGNDTSICEGETLILNAKNPNATFLWQDGSINSIYTTTKAGLFWVKVSNSCGVFSDSILISYYPKLIANLGNDTTLCDGESFTLITNSNNVVSYLWQDGSTNNNYHINQSGLYYVTVKDECEILTDSIKIEYAKCNCDVFIPNSFSPNYDGLNDEFGPKFNCEFAEYHFQVFDRWGQKILDTDNINNYWDGKFKSQELPVGVYYYLLQYRIHNKELKTISGDVTLIR